MNKNESFLAQKIRAQYEEKVSTDLDALRALDNKVKRPANIFGYVYGTAGALILGTGMSLVTGALGDAMGVGIAIGCVGIAVVSTTYALYKKILAARRAKYVKEITALSDKILHATEA